MCFSQSFPKLSYNYRGCFIFLDFFFFGEEGGYASTRFGGGALGTSTTTFSVVSFSPDPPKVHKIESLIQRYTSWGDIWDDLFWDEDELADFKYAAFEEELERMEEEG